MSAERNQRGGEDFPAALSQPARRALIAAGFSRIDHLAGVSEQDLLRLHGVGPKVIRQLRQALAEIGMTFAGS
ncbi:hypothetical protein [Actinopolymorpha pittospori]